MCWCFVPVCFYHKTNAKIDCIIIHVGFTDTDDNAMDTLIEVCLSNAAAFVDTPTHLLCKTCKHIYFVDALHVQCGKHKQHDIRAVHGTTVSNSVSHGAPYLAVAAAASSLVMFVLRA